MHQRLLLLGPSTTSIGLKDEKRSNFLGCKSARTSSRHPTLSVIFGKKDAINKEAPVSDIRSVRTLPIRLVTVRKSLDSGVQSVVNDYVGKVKRYCTFEELQVRPNPKNTSDVTAQVEAEGERVLRTITPKDWVVLVDERGRELTSEELATSIAAAGDTSG